MTTKTTTQHFFTALVAVFFSFFASAATYTTLKNGNWSNTTDVWSIDGVSPCGCSPGASVNDQTIKILHNITFTVNMRFGANTQVFIQQNRSLSGGPTVNIDVFDSYWNIEGNLFVGNLYTRTAGADIFLNSGGSIQTSASFEMNGGNVHVRSAYLRSFSAAVVSSTSHLRLSHGSKFEGLNSFNNYGILTVELGSCLSSVGTFQNNPASFVYGDGSIVSTSGNVRNDPSNPLSNFSNAISWCGGGGSTNLPTLANCALANSTCSGIVLPIELSEFSVELINEEYSVLNWTTESENNNAYFKVMKLDNGSNWVEIDRVYGAVNSTESLHYSSRDNNVEVGTSYYRLIQVDTDGNEFYTDVVSVNRKVNASTISIYPNPASSGENVQIVSENQIDFNYQVINASGQVVAVGTEEHTIQSEGLEDGIYFVRVESVNKIDNIKLIVKN